MMFIGDRMKTALETVSPQETVIEAQRLMQEKGVRHLPVVEDGRLVGIVSDRDMRDAMPSVLLDEMTSQQMHAKIGGVPVSEIMTRDPETISAAHTLQDALLVMHHKKVGAFPVVDEEGRLVGIISTRDILKAFINVLNIEEPGTLLCVVVEEKPGQLKRVVDIIAGENISLGSILVARYWDDEHRALFPYLLTGNVVRVKQKLIETGFTLIEPLEVLLASVAKQG